MLFDDLGAGAQPQVKRITQNDLSTDFPYFLGRNRFHGAVSTHRHERGGFDNATSKMQAPTTSMSLCTQ